MAKKKRNKKPITKSPEREQTEQDWTDWRDAADTYFKKRTANKKRDASCVKELVERALKTKSAWAGKNEDDKKPVRLWFRGQERNRPIESACGSSNLIAYPEPSLLSTSRVKAQASDIECRLDPLNKACQDRIEKLVRLELSNAGMFRTRGAPLAPSRPKTALDWAFLIQHYKCETRLLDWTASLFTAAFFAVGKNPDDKKNAAIWILEPRRLLDRSEPTSEKGEFSHVRAALYPDPKVSQFLYAEDDWNCAQANSDSPRGGRANTTHPEFRSHAPSRMGCPATNDIIEWHKLRYSKLSNHYSNVANRTTKDDTAPLGPGHFPLPVMPDWQIERVIAQQSRFTAHPMYCDQFRSMMAEDIISGRFSDETCFMDVILIPGDKKAEIKRELATLGINQFSLFPDLEALSEYQGSLNNRYGFSR